MQRVYRLLKEAREQGIIPWDWIVDETRELERCSTWDDPEHYARAVSRSYRRDFWNQQPVRVEVWSEKGTVRGVLRRCSMSTASASASCTGSAARPRSTTLPRMMTAATLIVLYVGDYDPSGLYMSERDIPDRLAKYGGDHVTLKRIALTRKQTTDDLPSFPASDKKKDPRYKWFVQQLRHRCWELDALDPNDLRALVEEAIRAEIEPVAWERCDHINKAEQESLRTILAKWKGAP